MKNALSQQLHSVNPSLWNKSGAFIAQSNHADKKSIGLMGITVAKHILIEDGSIVGSGFLMNESCNIVLSCSLSTSPQCPWSCKLKGQGFNRKHISIHVSSPSDSPVTVLLCSSAWRVLTYDSFILFYSS